MTLEYGPDIRYRDRRFGFGQLLGNEADYPESNFFVLSFREQALVMGWSNGCPRVLESIAKHGAEWMVSRYAENTLSFRNRP